MNKTLINWYKNHKRDLPWRQTKNPYKIWLSEIILQQTRVSQGLNYYQKFIAHYPNVQSLAQASEQEILNLWQGLGYYSRARNLHFTAKNIVKNYNGIFPDTYKELLKLKGVGTYTAAAIASFCYDEPVAVLDGNVFRVLSRLYGMEIPIDSSEGKKYFKNLAQENLSKKHPAIHNQAIMEFGALQCAPSQPKCENCPFSTKCVAFQTEKVSKLPIKQKKMKLRKRFLHFFLIKNIDEIIIEKRTKNDIWKNMYQLPLIEKPMGEDLTKNDIQKMIKHHGISGTQTPVLTHQLSHKLTHQHLDISFWTIEYNGKNSNAIKTNLINKLPMPIVIANFLDNYL